MMPILLFSRSPIIATESSSSPKHHDGIAGRPRDWRFHNYLLRICVQYAHDSWRVRSTLFIHIFYRVVSHFISTKTNTWLVHYFAFSPVVLLNGLDFYTESTDNVEFELWSRLGSFKEAKGTYEGWDLIAAGTVEGRGFGRYTAIPEDLFTQVWIPGGGGEKGTRAFYLTLTTINLVYKKGSGTDSDEMVHAKNDDLEVYEGEVSEQLVFYEHLFRRS